MASVSNQRPLAERPPAVSEPAPPFMLRDGTNSEGDTLGPNMIARRHSGGVEVIPIIHPERKPLPFSLAKAWHHFKIYRQDKEQTDEVIAAADAMPWRGLHDAVAAFLSSERGRALFQAEPYLPDFFDDHAALRRSPKGSLAHAYCDFMEREGLTAAGLVDSTSYRPRAPSPDGVDWYNDRLRDFHDLLHVLTGYDRDLLGEQCVFAFMYGQRPSPGHLVLAWAGNLMMKAKLKSRAPIIRTLREARRNGDLCPRIVELPIQELFMQPFDEVRRLLNIAEPVYYRKTHEIWQSEGIDPHAFMAKQAQ